MKINFATNNIYQSKNKNNISFGGARSDKIKHALTDDDDFILKQYYNDIKDIKPLSRKEERRLGEQIQQGGEKAEEAKQILITSALPSIVYYALQLKRYGFPLADTIQEANLSVLKLMNEIPYDGRKPFRNFIYETIYRRTHKAIAEKSRTITLPLYIFDNAQLIKDTEVKLGKRLQRIPTDAEIAEQAGFSKSYVKKLKKVSQPIVNLNNNIIKHIDKNPQKISQLYEDEIGLKIDRERLKKYLLHALDRVKSITPTEKLILISIYNIDDKSKENTLIEIAKKRNVTKERIRQIIENGIRKLNKAQFLWHKINLTEFKEYQNLSS